MSDEMLLGVLRMPIPTDPREVGVVEYVQFIARAKQAADRIEADTRRIEELKEANAKLFCHIADAKNALKMHHRWHLDCDELDSYAVPDGEGGWIGLNRAEEYADSEMHDITDAILSKGDT
jgi:hypothetical protein